MATNLTSIQDAIKSLPLSAEDSLRALTILGKLRSDEEREKFLGELTGRSEALAVASGRIAGAMEKLTAIVEGAERVLRRTKRRKAEMKRRSKDIGRAEKFLKDA